MDDGPGDGMGDPEGRGPGDAARHVAAPSLICSTARGGPGSTATGTVGASAPRPAGAGLRACR